jgi:hypothetical protein
MAFDGISKRFEEEQLEQRAFERAGRMLQDQAIDPRDFVDLYTVDVVRKEMDYVSQLKKQHDLNHAEEGTEREKRLATIAEAIVSDGIGLYDWLGENAHFIVPAPYDDYVNGIDGLVEIEESKQQASHIGLALDATFSADMAKKLGGLKRDIQMGRPFQMRYFSSDILDMRGALGNVPRAVFALEKETIRDLAELWLTKNKQALTEHPVQYQLLDQLIAQCEVLASIAQNRPELSARYEHAHTILTAARKERLEKVADEGTRDGAHERLLNALRVL